MKEEYLQLMKSRPELFMGGARVRPVTDPEAIARLEEEWGESLGVVYQTPRILVLRDAVVEPNGQKAAYIRMITRSAERGVAVLPLCREGVALIRIYRHGAARELLEIPRGSPEAGLSQRDNARKELYEETGLQGKLEYLGVINPDTGVLGTAVEAYLARVEDVGALSLHDPSEGISGYEILSLRELYARIARGEITDSFTLSALTLARAKNLL